MRMLSWLADYVFDTGNRFDGIPPERAEAMAASLAGPPGERRWEWFPELIVLRD